MKPQVFLSTFAASLALAACGSEDVENTPIDDVDEIIEPIENAFENDYEPVGGQLNDQQQANLNNWDSDGAVVEFQANQPAIMAESGSDAGTERSSPAKQSGNNASADMSGSNVTPLRPRSEMTFAFLDRNDDGQLSVAEYAIWAVRSDPTEPKPNDNTRPFTSSEQINRAGQTFFYFDSDGDTYLAPGEFTNARNSARTP